MKITDLSTKKRQIDEMYSVEVSSASGYYDLVKAFSDHKKLTGNLTEDAKLITTIGRLMEEDEEFDPFGHLVAADKIDVKDDCVLTLSKGNDKMQHMSVVYLSLPAGYTCPFADICKSTAHKHGGRFKDTNLAIKDFGDVRCYAASAEVAYPNVRKARWRNYDLLRKYKGDVNGMAKLIVNSLNFFEQKNPQIKLFRIHESGDFWSQEYFDAWLLAVQARPDILFYAYTKALPLWQARKDEIPSNLRLIASEGGTHDDLIDKEQFRKAIIVQDQGEAIEKRLHIDANDFLAAFGDQDFALLIHGVQSKGSGNTRQAKINSKILKDAAATLKIPPGEIERLLLHYTQPKGRPQIPVTIGDSVGDTQNVGDGDYDEVGAKWDQADMPFGMHD